MPRPPNVRNDMSKGWKNLNRHWKRHLVSKVEESHRLLDAVFANHRNPVVCWSGGKDSTVALHLARQHCEHLPIIHCDSGVEFPETVAFVHELAQSWKLDLIVTRPCEGESFWEVGSKYGWPIFGKAVASNVERARRTGNIRPQMSKLEKTLARSDVRISARCAEFLQERPSKEAEKRLEADVKLIGLRASESRARARLWVDHGDYYFVKRYFGRNQGMWKANPIALWTEEDIWSYTEENDIPHCSLYDMGYPRNGCWCCAMGIRVGQLKRLRLNHPKLFERLVTKTEMGDELLKAKLTVLPEEDGPHCWSGNPRLALERFPDFLDKV
jgi:3'-phosphoadenosine 5'-phosphosulfate sulfotransferase (PAPS reductase)/FAD synthetase